MMKELWMCLPILFSTLIGFSACAATPEVSSNITDPVKSICSLVTRQEAEAILGTALRDPVGGGPLPPEFAVADRESDCSYDEAHQRFSVTLHVMEYKTMQGLTSHWERWGSKHGEGVAGLGDKAVWIDGVNPGQYLLYVQKGLRIIEFERQGKIDTSIAKEQATKFLQEALSRIK